MRIAVATLLGRPGSIARRSAFVHLSVLAMLVSCTGAGTTSGTGSARTEPARTEPARTAPALEPVADDAVATVETDGSAPSVSVPSVSDGLTATARTGTDDVHTSTATSRRDTDTVDALAADPLPATVAVDQVADAVGGAVERARLAAGPFMPPLDDAVVHHLIELARAVDTARGGPGVGVVEHATQTLWAFDGAALTWYPVSTGKGGISNKPQSSGTPPGTHRIDRIVRGEEGEIVRGFGPTGERPRDDGVAHMTTRAFGLVGLGTENTNSRRRGIFLHGTNFPERLGRAASGGCIRVADGDAVRLDGVLQVGSLLHVLTK